MGLFDSLVAAATKGEGTPWGAPAQRGGMTSPTDWMTTGKGTPWGAEGQKGISSLADPVTLAATQQGFMGNSTGLADKALFTGDQTPWGATGHKGMAAFQDPGSKSIMGRFGNDSFGGNSFANSFEGGANQSVGMGPEATTAPTQKAAVDKNSFTAPSFDAYNQTGQEKINSGLARSRNAMAAGMQKHGALAGGDAGLGFGDIAQSGMEQRGGLANAIAGMQDQSRTQQADMANHQNYQDYLNQYNAYSGDQQKRAGNQDAWLKAGGLVASLASKMYGG